MVGKEAGDAGGNVRQGIELHQSRAEAGGDAVHAKVDVLDKRRADGGEVVAAARRAGRNGRQLRRRRGGGDLGHRHDGCR